MNPVARDGTGGTGGALGDGGSCSVVLAYDLYIGDSERRSNSSMREFVKYILRTPSEALLSLFAMTYNFNLPFDAEFQSRGRRWNGEGS